ncbi:hypothetical protein [Alteribacter keqinensis]|uniref:Uncharacterized protein n=1 Tax=Alteribacter keqinensis TaxID=2483800 RepID=A0A3M7TWG0_9BACI|nr:hypothetical protein [Alteribacter keqinensis]RNA69906.1 hypothetical protein EBO34_08230 [Alteribacter keqinensis]
MEAAYNLEENLSLRRASSADEMTNFFNANAEAEILGDNDIQGVMINTVPGEYRLTSKIDSGESTYLHVGNSYEEDVPYAIIAFLGWEQVNIGENHVLYTTIKGGSTGLIEFSIPEVEEIKPLQVFAFPFPYEITEGNYDADRVFSSQRKLIYSKFS